MRRSILLPLPVALAAIALIGAAEAPAHVERPSTWPTYSAHVPALRTHGPSIVVCRPGSGRRIADLPSARMRRANARLLRRCSTRSIQTAVNRAHNGTRILILPGVYTEPASRRKPFDDPRCADLTVMTAEGSEASSYRYQLRCPNARNLIAIVGDRDGDRRCDSKCRLQITGTARPRDVRIVGDRAKQNVIRADRADGIYLGNFTIQYSDFNNIYVLETAGFRVSRIVSRWSREYGVLSFASEAGLYEHLDTYGNGDSGVYPGSGSQGLESERQCRSYGTELRHVNSHGNNLGYSGTAGDSVWVHDSRFHHNATGLATDSFATGHPGMPQHCARWERNRIYSNNVNVFSPQRQAYCMRPPLERDPRVVCSAFQVPVGTGALIAGGNGNRVVANRIYDNWRSGAALFWVPAVARGVTDPARQRDTSFGNQFTGNVLGIAPRGARRPNGTDFWWDEEGAGNCWSSNRTAGGGAPVGDPQALPACGSEDAYRFREGNQAKLTALVPCATWDPQTNPFPVGCDWFTKPPRPGAARPASAADAEPPAARTVTLGSGAGPLAWSSPSLLTGVSALPADRILGARIVNASNAPVELVAGAVRVVDGAGRELRSNAIFADTYLHRLWPFNGGTSVRPRREQLRIGARVRLEPGASAPLTVAWRGGAGGAPRLQYPGGSLPLVE